MQSLKEVFSKPTYIFISVLVMWIIFSLALWLPHWQLLTQIISTTSPADSVAFLISLYGSIETNFTVLSGAIIVILAIQFGINVALMAYLIQRQMDVRKNVTTNMWGMVFGVLGMGCAACGSVILTGILSLFGGVWIMAYLPFGGEEFGMVGILLLGYASYSLNKRISEPLVCNN